MTAMSNTLLHRPADLPEEHAPILERLFALYRELFLHDGYGAMRVEMRFLKKGQKEILVICGKEYRFVVDAPDAASAAREGLSRRVRAGSIGKEAD